MTPTKGLVAMIVTSAVRPATAECLADLRSHNDRKGLHDIEYRIIPAALVEAGRDEACSHALSAGYDWLLQIDADAVFSADSVAYALQQWWPSDFDIIGAYCQLRGPQGRPTIDTGSGTWEEHYPGEGIIPVIRTGGHFLFIKTAALRRFGPPWFRSRIPLGPLQALAEVDNFARTHRGGRNPLAGEAWDDLIDAARPVSRSATHVGEDSAFCDSACAAGLRVAVDTDWCVGHLSEETIWPDRFINFMAAVRRQQRQALGIIG